MKKLTRLFLIYLAFTVEVKIHADSGHHGKFSKAKPVAEQWISEPEGCQPGTENCAIMAKQKKTVVPWNDQEITLSKNASLWWTAGDNVRLVKGSLSVNLNGKAQVTMPNGSVSGNGLVLIERQDLNVTVTAIDGEILISPAGSRQLLRLPSGFRVTMGAVESDGIAATEIPQVANPSSTLRTWWELYSGPKADFLETAKVFVKAAPGKAQLASEWHQQMVQREVAEANLREQQMAKRRADEAKEQALMRSMFRKLNYLDN